MDETKLNRIGSVIESTPNSILIRIDDDKVFEKNKSDIKIGKYLQIKEGNHNFVICAIQNIKINECEKYIINTQPIGLYAENEFKQGSSSLPSPTEVAYVIDESIMKVIFDKDSKYSFGVGKLVQNDEIKLHINGDSFFSKHIAVVGSTGSGKSCTVARILQDVVGIDKRVNINKDEQNNSHIIIFDIHSEYKSAFSIKDEEKFNLNLLDVDKLKLPYWLMNSEELESLFIESNEQNSHNQISQFKKAVILNKEKHNDGLDKITYDTPVYFSIAEVYNYIYNKNYLTVYEKDSKIYFASLEKVEEYSEDKLWHKTKFEASTGNSKHKLLNAKVSKYGGFNGEFDRFLSRLDTKLRDKRLAFLLQPFKDDDTPFHSVDFKEIITQFLGYLDKSNITIIDLSGIPFEVMSITVSLICQISI